MTSPGASLGLCAAWRVLETPNAPFSERRAALARVHEELRALAPRDDRRGGAEELANEALLRVERALVSPSHRRRDDCCDASVRAYLRRALKSAAATLVPGHDQAFDTVDETAVPSRGGADASPAPARDPDVLAPVLADFHARVVVPCGAGRRAGRAEALATAVDEMVDLLLTRRSVAEIVGLAADDPGFGPARAAMYTRHMRARQDLLAEVKRRKKLGILRGEDAERFAQVLDALRRRSVRGSP